MDKDLWVFLNNGHTAGEIKEKAFRDDKVTGMVELASLISDDLRDYEYIVVQKEQMLYPFHEGWPMTGRDFKKRGNQFNLGIGTRAEMIEGRASPQQLIVGTVNKEHGKIQPFSQGDILSQAEKDNETYNRICRRGFKWDRRSGYLHAIMPQVDLIRGWRLASLVIYTDMDIRYSNPGNIFFTEIPTTRDSPKARYKAKMYNFATTLPDGYADWVTIDGAIAGGTDEFEKAMRGIDIYSSASLRYKFHEFLFNFQYVAASVLRAHYTDKRYAEGKFKNRKRVDGQKIEPVLLNIPIPPSEHLMKFGWKLDNNVLIEYTDPNGKTRLKKLNAAEKEAFLSTKLFLSSAYDCYNVDESLESLDHVVGQHIGLYNRDFVKQNL